MITGIQQTQEVLQGPTRGAREIVVGYDGSEPARRALERAATLAAPQASITVVAVIPQRSQPGHLGSRKRVLAEAEALLAGRDVKVLAVEGQGDPAEVLMAAAAAYEADLLVVGSGGHGPVAGAFLGSVSAALARGAPQDLLIVR